MIKLVEGFNFRKDDPETFIPKNNQEFLDAFRNIAENIPKGSLDMAVTKMSSEMYNMMKGDKELKKLAKVILKNIHGSVKEADGGYGDLGAIPSAPNRKLKLKRDPECTNEPAMDGTGKKVNDECKPKKLKLKK